MPNQSGTGGDLQLPAAPGLLVRHGDVRHAVLPAVHASTCTPDSDTNIVDGSNPAAADYIGKHSGTAFMEMQFYPPGWAPFQDLGGISCSRHAVVRGPEHRQPVRERQHRPGSTTTTCQDAIGGIEYVNFAFITKNGTPQAPPDPLHATVATFTPNPDAGSVHELGRPARRRHARHPGRLPGRDPRSDHRPVGLDDGERRERLRAGEVRADRRRPAAKSPPTPSTRCTRPRASTRACPWAAHTLQRRLLRRDRPLRVLQRSRTQSGELHQPPGPGRRPGSTATTSSASTPADSTARPDRRLHRHRQRLRRPVRTSRTGREQARTAVRIRSYHPTSITFTSPLFNGNQNYDRVALRDRPAADRSGRLRRHLQPLDRSGLRRTRRRARTSTRSTRPATHANRVERAIASGSSAGRTSAGTTNTFGGNFDRGVRTAAVQLLSGAQPGDASAGEQLPERPRQQSLPGVIEARSGRGGAPFGALPHYEGTTTRRAFDQFRRQGLSGVQANPTTTAETFT